MLWVKFGNPRHGGGSGHDMGNVMGTTETVSWGVFHNEADNIQTTPFSCAHSRETAICQVQAHVSGHYYHSSGHRLNGG